jgi:hypothetical protein
MTKNTDFARMLHMIAPYRVGYGEIAYDVEHLRNYDVIYLHTDDSYVSATMYFDKAGKFIGFYDPDYAEMED